MECFGFKIVNVFITCCVALADALPSNLSPFTSVPPKYVYLNKGDIVVVGCSQRLQRDANPYPIAWAFENTTEIWLRGIDVNFRPEIPVSIVGDFNLLIDSNQYDFHNTTLLCYSLLDNQLLSNPVTFLVYGKLWYNLYYDRPIESLVLCQDPTHFVE